MAANYLVAGLMMTVMLMFCAGLISYIWIRKYLNLAAKVKIMKKTGKNPVIIDMQLLDGDTFPLVVSQNEPTFDYKDQKYNLPTISRYYKRHRIYDCPKLTYNEGYAEALDPELHEQIFNADQEIIDKDEDGNDLKDEKGNKIIYVKEKIAVLPKGVPPRMWGSIVKWSHKLGMMAGQKNEKMLLLAAFCAAGAAGIAALLVFKLQGNVSDATAMIANLQGQVGTLSAKLDSMAVPVSQSVITGGQ